MKKPIFWLGFSAILTLTAMCQNQDPAIIRLTWDGMDKERPTWSSDGKRLYFARHESGGMDIRQYWLEIPQETNHSLPSTSSSTALKRVIERKEPEMQAVLSPDGSRILLTLVNRSGTQGDAEIALIKADGSDLKLVAATKDGKLSHQEWPSWNPNGTRFAFSSTHEDNQEIHHAKADGSDIVRVTQHPGTDTHPCWSPDGKHILFAADRWGGLEIAKAKIDGTETTRLTKSRGLDDYPAWSPDGSKIAFVSNRDGQFEIYLMNADGSNPINLTHQPGRDVFPSWTPDGKALVFVAQSDRGNDVFMIRLLDKSPK